MKRVLPFKTIPVTLILIGVNILVFLLMLLTGMNIWQGSGQQLLHAGANYWPLTVQQHQLWRLLSSMFLHAGIWHLFVNMVGLFIAGIFLEPVLQSIRYGIAYIITGVIANFISSCYHKNAVGVGASGAIFGMYGVFIVLLATHLFHAKIRRFFLVFISIFLALQVVAAIFSSGIDNAAHLAGFISGGITGYLLLLTLAKANGNKPPE